MTQDKELSKIGEITSGIPVPSRLPNCDSRRKYNFGGMMVGESMLIPANSRSTLYYYQLKHPEFRFVVRLENGNCRVWRIEGPTEH